jgi:type IV pilus assembly protein PilB
MSTSKPNLSGLTGIVRRLVDNGHMAEDAGRLAMVEATQARQPIHIFLAEKKLADSGHIAVALAGEFGLPLLDLELFDVTLAPINLVKEEWYQKHNVIPLLKRGARLWVGVSDPTDTRSLDELKFQTNMAVDSVIVDLDQLRRAIDQALSSSNALGVGGPDDDGLENLTVSAEEELLSDAASGGIDASSEDTPIVKFVNKVLLDAISRGASDIHFEPYETEVRVRLRVDGVLRNVAKAPNKFAQRLAARLKVMASLDIAEKRLPQDGRIKLNVSKTKQTDFRVSTCPTLFGEKVVLRILDAAAAKLGIEKLGYEDDQKALFMDALSRPYGMVLVTGPTGSGKTVSLYTGLNILNTEERNISTAEDPVEIRMHGINQVQVNPKKGMTFAAALRSFLRQDPDVIMVGEIRDLETAEIAIKAAQTGHMVLSTLHTNDAPQTISRLMNMGIASYNITSSVILVIAQRLARRLCPVCKRVHDLPKAALLNAGFTETDIKEGLVVYEAVGCSECTDGYRGRLGIYQVMPMLESIQRIILEGGGALAIGEAARAAGVRDLRDSALLKAKQGVTSLAEIDRVTQG